MSHWVKPDGVQDSDEFGALQHQRDLALPFDDRGGLPGGAHRGVLADLHTGEFRFGRNASPCPPSPAVVTVTPAASAGTRNCRSPPSQVAVTNSTPVARPPRHGPWRRRCGSGSGLRRGGHRHGRIERCARLVHRPGREVTGDQCLDGVVVPVGRRRPDRRAPCSPDAVVRVRRSARPVRRRAPGRPPVARRRCRRRVLRHQQAGPAPSSAARCHHQPGRTRCRRCASRGRGSARLPLSRNACVVDANSSCFGVCQVCHRIVLGPP